MHDAIFDGKAMYRVSLRTKDRSLALQRFQQEDAKFCAKVALVIGSRVSEPVISSEVGPRGVPRQLTAGILNQVEADLAESSFRRWRRLHAVAELGEREREEFQREMDLREQEAESIRAILIDGEVSRDPRLPDIADAAARIAIENNLDVNSAGAMAALRSAVRKGMLAGERRVDELLRNGAGSLVQSEEQASFPKLQEVIDVYMASKDRPRTIAEIREVGSALVALVGNVSVADVKSSHIRNFLKGQAARQVGGKDPQSVVRPLSRATLQKKLALIRAAFAYSIERDELQIANPASGIDVTVFAQTASTAAMPDKRPFSLGELQKIFAHPWFTGCASVRDIYAPGSHRLDGMHYWVPVVAALTGMRAGELGGLRVDEVAFDDQYPHIVVQSNEFRPTKTGKSRRVPILDALAEIGFCDWVENARRSGRARLFDDWLPPRKAASTTGEASWSNGAVIRAFNRNVVPTTLQKAADGRARLDVTFHSFRGAFKSMLGLQRHALPSNFINEVIGHAKSALDERYVGVIPIDETYPAMKACAYSGLTLPRLPTVA
nr:tyrosine-type recombinase/integrase [Sphingopyxis indica]